MQDQTGIHLSWLELLVEEEKVKIKMERYVPEAEQKLRRKYQSLKVMMVIVCITTLLLGFFGGLLIAAKGGAPINGPTKAEEIKNLLSEKWYYANQHEDLDSYLDERAARGITTFEEDPYTVYMSADELEEFIQSINVNYVGLGVSILEDQDKNVHIIKVLNNTPAMEAGLMAGDVIYEIDGKSMLGVGIDEVQNNALGQENTTVNVKVQRGNEIVEYDITRRYFESTAYGEQVADDVYYLDISSFGANTAKDARGYLSMVEGSGVDKLIIDLRDNGGGFTTTARDLAGIFLGKGATVIKEQTSDGKQTVLKTMGNNLDFIKKIVILVNGNTASASEVFTLAMKEYFPNLTVVGTQTYGKGSAQSLFTLSDGSSVKVTTEKWFSASDISIDGVGITPDVEVMLDDAFYMATVGEIEEVKEGQYSPELQLFLSGLKLFGYPLEDTNGYLNAEKAALITKYQQEHGLEVTGTLNTRTYRSMIYELQIAYNNHKELYDAQYIKALEILHQ